MRLIKLGQNIKMVEISCCVCYGCAMEHSE